MKSAHSDVGSVGTVGGVRRWSLPSGSQRATVLDRAFLAPLQGPLEAMRIRLKLWDGTSLYCGPASPIATVTIRDRGMLLGLLLNRHLTFGEGFSAGRLDVDGNLVGLLEAIYRTFAPRRANGLARLSKWRRNTVDRSRHDIHHHYDLGNDFYRLWLDGNMQYTCAYFPHADMSLEAAQLAKMHHVCQKLSLRPGERVVEAGCGWGSFALFMAKEYGVTVRAYNISHEQITEARRRAHAEGLGDRVEFVEDDYRTISGCADVFVSIGMLEHVGLAQFPVMGQVIDRALDRQRGRGLLHFIGRDFAYPLNPWIRKRIFPGGYTPTLAQVTSQVLEPSGFSVLDVENLRVHYARTLAHWLTRFESQTDRVTARFDASFVRAWRLYLAGAQAAFTTGRMQLFQVTFGRGQWTDVPWTRGTTQ